MTTYRTIAATETDPDSPVTSTLVIAMSDNPTSIAEAADTAPPVQSSWHPFDQVFIGDGNTGVIYDFAVDGLVTEIDSPDFEVGFEYRFIADGLESDGAAIGVQLQAFLTTSAIFEILFSLSSGVIGGGVGFDFWISPPMTSRLHHMIEGIAVRNDNSTVQEIIGGAGGSNGVQTVTFIRIRSTQDNYSGGKVYMFRRRIDYAN